MRFQSKRQQLLTQGLTIYQDGFGSVKETRCIPANEDVTEIEFMDVSPKVEVASILLEGIHVLEQSYNTNLISKKSLLEKYLGKIIVIGNEELSQKREVRLVSASAEIIVERVDTKQVIINPEGQLILPSLPDGLLTTPTLVCKIKPIPKDVEAKISYLTSGLEWQVNYVAKISESKLDFIGWIQLSNNTGMDFLTSRLKLASGKIYRQKDVHSLIPQTRMLSIADQGDSVFEAREFADTHIYTIDRQVDLPQGQMKQISFLQLKDVTFRKVYKLEAHSERAKVVVEFDNTEANQLGIPLPMGTLKVYEQDQDGEMEFIGENTINSTAKQQKISIGIGEAFDIISQNWEKKRERKERFDYVTHVYTLENRKSDYARVVVNHQIFEQVWKMESSSHDYEVKRSNELEFRVHIAAEKKTEVEFTYKVDNSARINGH